MLEAKFAIGDIIQHHLFTYRGVIFDVDFQFLGSDEWYEKVAHSHPPKDQPWYHVLVDNAQHVTYVAERNLTLSNNHSPIFHPLLDEFFIAFQDGRYLLNISKN